MASLPQPIRDLTASLSQLPGIGPRSAERLALYLVQTDSERVKELAAVLVNACEKVTLCEVCGGLTERQPCEFCESDSRDDSLVCVVERPLDILNIERSGSFSGRFHVLGGKISPLNGIEPEDLRIESLEKRIAEGVITEIVVALGSDVESDATSHYLSARLKRDGLRVTRIAHGLPAGSGLDFADEVTLSKALEGRRDF